MRHSQAEIGRQALHRKRPRPADHLSFQGDTMRLTLAPPAKATAATGLVITLAVAAFVVLAAWPSPI
jgi:hypothetical protein